MFVTHFLVLFAATLRLSGGYVDWNQKVNSVNVRKRILQIARGTVEDCRRKIVDLNPYKFMYEESPQFEIGYVFGEILERYRKIVEIVKHTRLKKENFFHSLHHMEMAQFLYLENYHLVMMINEIPRKYAEFLEFADLKMYQVDDVKLEDQLSPEEQMARYREMMEYEKEQRRLKKKLAKMEARLNTLEELQDHADGEGGGEGFGSNEPRPKKPPNWQWPLDYGWEPDPKKWLR